MSGLIFFFFANQEITSSFQLFHVKARNFLDFLLPVVLAAVFVSLAVGVVASLFFPRPIAGALYRIEEDLKRISATGDLTASIRLREGDQAAPVAERINSLLADFRARAVTAQQAAQDLDRLGRENQTGTDPSLTEISVALESAFGRLKT